MHLHVGVVPPPLVPRHVAELVPLRQRSQAAQAAKGRVDVRRRARVAGGRGVLALVGVERLVPPVQLLVPRLLCIRRGVLARVAREHTHVIFSQYVAGTNRRHINSEHGTVMADTGTRAYIKFAVGVKPILNHL